MLKQQNFKAQKRIYNDLDQYSYVTHETPYYQNYRYNNKQHQNAYQYQFKDDKKYYIKKNNSQEQQKQEQEQYVYKYNYIQIPEDQNDKQLEIQQNNQFLETKQDQNNENVSSKFQSEQQQQVPYQIQQQKEDKQQQDNTNQQQQQNDKYEEKQQQLQNIKQLLPIYKNEELFYEDNNILDLLQDINSNNQNLKPIYLKSNIKELVKNIIPLQYKIKLNCLICKTPLITKSVLIKKTQAPAIKILHCNQIINIEFEKYIQQNSQNLEEIIINQIPSINYDIIFQNALCAIECECGNILQDNLVLDKVLQLKNKTYKLLQTENYRKLCQLCCREVTIKKCELYY